MNEMVCSLSEKKNEDFVSWSLHYYVKKTSPFGSSL